MLHLDRATGAIAHLRFRKTARLLRTNDLLVVNDTRVSALRLLGHRPTGAQAQALVLTDLGGGRFRALVKPGRRLRQGAVIEFGSGLSAEILAPLGAGLREIQFASATDLAVRLAEAGSVPLPPYVHARLDDPERYQTVYACTPGSAAAPTAGLHFTADLLDEIRAKGVRVASVTLDVGLDTFRRVDTQHLDDHAMHGERCSLPEATAEAIAKCKGRIVAVGTTTVRTLESFASGPRQVEAGEKVTRLFIRPGHRFQIVDGAFTNFHMPRTTMLMMVAALAGQAPLRRAYKEALEREYRFLSFGDAMLVL